MNGQEDLPWTVLTVVAGYFPGFYVNRRPLWRMAVHFGTESISLRIRGKPNCSTVRDQLHAVIQIFILATQHQKSPVKFRSKSGFRVHKIEKVPK